ncbi:uncharacterized protein LOC108458650 [Gossypium arboreum]|uniref:uncharacterized protein LOC108458650 n=1 Tax=Gossypium arboreum TaxID=29729 RepID=UPI0008196212|nr:uncharacterized protein LOC108458650 [Gossypium arboreum]
MAKFISNSKLSKESTSGIEDGTLGCASNKFPRIFQEYNREHSPAIISLLETRVSGSKADNIIAKLGLLNSHRVEAVGFSGGIWIGWKSSIHLEIIFNHPQFILTRIRPSGSSNPIFIFFVYGSPNKQKRKELWNSLNSSIPLGNYPWAAIGDSNAMTKSRRCPFFGNFVDNAKLYDLEFRGPPFTWYRGLLFERLDRALGNEAWIQAFPNSLVTHLPKIKSDHRPLLLFSNPEVYLPKGRPFHFLAGWVEHPNFGNFVKDKWAYSGDMSNSLSMFTRDLKNWNKTVELKIQQELDNILRHEEILWKQKACCDWLHFGDHSTKFFHSRTLRQRKNNRITAIHNDHGDWIYEPEAIEAEANKFFQNLYWESPGPMGSLPFSQFPGLDQVENPEEFIHFRPISLCSVLYKLVMKIIANRFKFIFPKIIGPEQAGFIAGRNITDNVIIAQEVIHSMRSFPKRKWITIRIDLEKAYDRVRWDFINAFLQAAGIHSFLINIIMSSITNSSMQVLWNGVPLSKFRPGRGIRQGCPLSPYLFVLCMDWLGQEIYSTISKGQWKPIRLSRSGPSISHLFFTDDLVIFSKVDQEHCRLIKEILGRFYDFSGHKINAGKINIFFAKGVDVTVADSISTFFSFQKVQSLGLYLGILLFHQRVTNSTMHFVVEKVRRKLQNWDAKRLSIAGRIILAQSVLMTIPSYFMQSMMIPRGICNEIESLVKQFIWGSSEQKKKMALVGWDSMC